MKQGKVAFYMFLTIIGGLIFVGSQAWEWKNFIKGEYGAIETKGGSILQFVNAKGERVKLEEFAATLPEDREQRTRGNALWFGEEAALPTYSVAEVQAGFKANPDLLIRTEVIYDEETAKTSVGAHPTLNDKEFHSKHKTVLN